MHVKMQTMQTLQAYNNIDNTLRVPSGFSATGTILK